MHTLGVFRCFVWVSGIWENSRPCQRCKAGISQIRLTLCELFSELRYLQLPNSLTVSTSFALSWDLWHFGEARMRTRCLLFHKGDSEFYTLVTFVKYVLLGVDCSNYLRNVYNSICGIWGIKAIAYSNEWLHGQPLPRTCNQILPYHTIKPHQFKNWPYYNAEWK